jgi:SPP1 gp7 family putative phage head morphogenesis protein
LFLNPVIDIANKKIKTIKRLPGISMQRQEGMDGNFLDQEKAFRQIDPISLLIIQDFPLWAINHIRWDHEEGDRYGNSQYLQCRGYWKKLNMTEEDLVIRRRTRAVPRRVHILGNKDNPGTKTDIDNYKATNQINQVKASITSDYYLNGLGDVKDLNADAHLDEIKDVEHLQEVYMVGTGVPLHILGFGKIGAGADIIKTQEKQFKEDTQELRDLLEYGDSSPYSGLRFIFSFGLALQGIDPNMVEFNVRWAEEDNETASERMERVIAARSAQPKPIMSQKTAIAITAKDNGFENQSAIEAEIEEIELELEQDRLDQQTLQSEINPANPSTSPISHSVASRASLDTIEPKKKDFFPLHNAKTIAEEQRFSRMIRRHFTKVSKELKKETKDHVSKIGFLKPMLDDDKTPELVDQYMDLYQEIWDRLEPDLADEYLKFYWRSADAARESISTGMEIKLSQDFINPDLQHYLQEQSSTRVTGINETNRDLLRKELNQAYTNGEKTAQWQARIDKVLGLNTPTGRADMIARTEIAWGYSRGLIATYKEVGIDRVQWLAVMDKRTCSVCAGRNEKVYSLGKIEGMIPAHPRCRCTIVSAE